jgi:fatty acid desaturase
MKLNEVMAHYTIADMKQMSMADRELVFITNTDNHKLEHHDFPTMSAMSVEQLQTLVDEVANEDHVLISTQYDFFEVANRHHTLDCLKGGQFNAL